MVLDKLETGIDLLYDFRYWKMLPYSLPLMFSSVSFYKSGWAIHFLKGPHEGLVQRTGAASALLTPIPCDWCPTPWWLCPIPCHQWHSLPSCHHLVLQAGLGEPADWMWPMGCKMPTTALNSSAFIIETKSLKCGVGLLVKTDNWPVQKALSGLKLF